MNWRRYTPLTSMAKHRLRVLETKELRMIFGPKKKEEE
jgi:hypothetical protein